MQSLLVHSVLNLALGAGLGLAGGMFGIGGGLIAIPVLGYLYGMDQHLAQGTALVMIAPNVLVAVWRYHQKHRIDIRAVTVISLFAMAATYAAARFATGLDARALHFAFAIFLVFLALYFLCISNAPASPNHAVTASAVHLPARALPVLGLLSGAISGMFTVGGSLVVVPALVSYFGMAQTRAQGMALALVVPGAVIALATYAAAGHVVWNIGFPLALGGMLSVSWGVALAHRFSANWLRLMFCLVLFGTAGMILLLPA